MPFEIVDTMKGKGKAYQEISHKHNGSPSRLEMVQCERCRYDRAENSIPKKEFKHLGKTVTKITIHRGRLDDCIWWSF